MDDSSSIRELDLDILYFDVAVAVITGSQNRRSDTEGQEYQNDDNAGPHSIVNT
jgi:hypothetical protein